MAVRRNDSWKSDHDLEDILRKYVRGGLQREEILDFVSRNFSQYAWSLGTLDRRLHHFQICHTDRNVTVDEVEVAVKFEDTGTSEGVLLQFPCDFCAKPLNCDGVVR